MKDFAMPGLPRPAETAENPFRALRQLLRSPRLAIAMEAHDALSALIVQEAGFEAIWASGLAISTAAGVRDANELSWTEVVERVERMTDAVALPIILDGDTGYGNFNTVRRLVKRLCQRSVAGLCIEDKLFPKTNSFIDARHQLAECDEFCGRIRAAKDVQSDPDFSVIARTEALVLGESVDFALARAHAYREAGADAILVHSKSRSADPVLSFASRWEATTPLVIVPTMYAATPTAAFEAAGISMVIWANHTLRASMQAMRSICRRIMRERSVANVEPEIASLGEIFALIGYDELHRAEEHYLGGPVDA